MSDDARAQQRYEVAPTALEWAVRIVSVALVALLLGYLVYQAFRPDVAPDFAARPRLDRVEVHDGGYALPVDVRNVGTRGVSELTVTVALRDGGNVVEEESIVVPLLGHGEQVTVVAWFDADPGAHDVEVDIGSYTGA